MASHPYLSLKFRFASRFALYSLQAAVLLAGHSLRAGYEIADITDAAENGFRGYTRVYLDYGDNPITAEEWESYEPPLGYLKNTPRNPEFNAENTFSSPGRPAPEVSVEDISGYTWKFIAQIQSAMWPYNQMLFPATINPYQAAFATATPPAGSIKFSSNEKNQEMIFWARENNLPDGAPIPRFFITDEWGNKYIMGASGAATDAEIPASFAAAVLPEGWQKSTGYLEETLSLLPAYGAGDQAHYNLFRESGDNTFFQIEWGESGHGIAEQIAGMPIWGGSSNDTLRGRAGDDNLIHGAEGDDVIFELGNISYLYGDAGIDTVVFPGNFSDYSLLHYAHDGAELTLWGFGYEKYLYDVEYLRFDDATLATSAIPEPSALALLMCASVFAWFCSRHKLLPNFLNAGLRWHRHLHAGHSGHESQLFQDLWDTGLDQFTLLPKTFSAFLSRDV